jgi:hypothetical protein
MAELTEEQKTKFDAIKAKVRAREALSADDTAFLEEAHEALESIPAGEEVSE